MLDSDPYQMNTDTKHWVYIGIVIPSKLVLYRYLFMAVPGSKVPWLP